MSTLGTFLAHSYKDGVMSDTGTLHPDGIWFEGVSSRGHEAWQAISISRNDRVVAVILGNPVMIDAYRAGIPGNGKPVPDWAKMAKVHWNPKQNEFFPDATVPGSLLKVASMEKDSKRFADSGGWGYAVFDYDAAFDTFKPAPRLARRRRGTTPSAGSRATRERRREITFLRSTGSGEPV
jgi:cytochrome P460